MEFIKATNKDLNFLFNLRNEPVNVKYSKRGVLQLDEIKKDYLNNTKKKVYIAKQKNESVGYLILNIYMKIHLK